MTQLYAGDMLPNDSLLLEKREDMYCVTDDIGNTKVMRAINGYKSHDMILCTPKEMFCVECEELVHTQKDDYPYVRMLYQFSNKCEPTESFN